MRDEFSVINDLRQQEKIHHALAEISGKINFTMSSQSPQSLILSKMPAGDGGL
jgi:hypothetical protein